MHQILQDTLHTAPLMGTVLLSFVIILINAMKKESETMQYMVSVFGLITNIGLAVWTFPLRGSTFHGMLLSGGFASFMTIIFLTAALLTILLSREYIKKIGINFGEYFIMIILAVAGMIVFANALDLLSTFLGLEIMSICLYTLAGMPRKVLRSNEASLKYFLLGAFATGFFLYGIALIYGSAGTTNIADIAQTIPTLKSNMVFLIGSALLLIGFMFKVGAVPFHMWVPDVYEGSPTMVSAFMSSGAKAAAFGALLLVFTSSFDFTHSAINSTLSVLAVASMVIGNVVAISQSNVKRMLAYSSIAHAGYMLVGITTGTDLGMNGVLFYLVSYVLTNIGAFGVVAVIENQEQQHTAIDHFNGLGFRKPLLGILMSVFLFSLIGLPPFSGFFGKYYIFYAAIDQGYTWLTIVGVVTSMISVYYYLRVVVAMYFRSADSEDHYPLASTSAIPLVFSAAGILALGILPKLLLDWMSSLF